MERRTEMDESKKRERRIKKSKDDMRHVEEKRRVSIWT